LHKAFTVHPVAVVAIIMLFFQYRRVPLIVLMKFPSSSRSPIPA